MLKERWEEAFEKASPQTPHSKLSEQKKSRGQICPRDFLLPKRFEGVLGETFLKSFP
mgnify:CR=1 FL=1